MTRLVPVLSIALALSACSFVRVGTVSYYKVPGAGRILRGLYGLTDQLPGLVAEVVAKLERQGDTQAASH